MKRREKRGSFISSRHERGLSDLQVTRTKWREVRHKDRAAEDKDIYMESDLWQTTGPNNRLADHRLSSEVNMVSSVNTVSTWWQDGGKMAIGVGAALSKYGVRYLTTENSGSGVPWGI